MPDICGIELLTKTRVALTASEKDGKRAGVQKKKKNLNRQKGREYSEERIPSRPKSYC